MHLRVHPDPVSGAAAVSSASIWLDGFGRHHPSDVPFGQLNGDVAHVGDVILRTENANPRIGECSRSISRPSAPNWRSSRSTAGVPATHSAENTMDALDKALDGTVGASALVITGGGDRAFVPLAAISAEIATLRTELRRPRWPGGCAFRSVTGSPGFLPVIAALNGHAFGGAPRSPSRLISASRPDDIKIGFNQISLAIMPAWGGAEAGHG